VLGANHTVFPPTFLTSATQSGNSASTGPGSSSVCQVDSLSIGPEALATGNAENAAKVAETLTGLRRPVTMPARAR
jgi:hypothetical protein